MVSTLASRVLTGTAMELSERKENVLRIIVSEYVSRASSIGSEEIAKRYGLGVSSATIRNDMARLEEEGYIQRRHISGGGIPTDKGYRYYVEALIREHGVPVAEQLMISHLFHQVERELEQWTRLAAVLLSRMVHNVAIVTSAKPVASRFRHLDMVAVQDFVALLILLLKETRIRQQLVAFDEAISQDGLSAICGRLNDGFKDMTKPQIIAHTVALSPLESQVRDIVVHLMDEEDRQRYEEPLVQGVHHIVTQPEFASGDKVAGFMEALEHRRLVKDIIPVELAERGVQVIIGSENRDDAMRECSVVIARYGVPDEVDGVLGVLGPTRMPYERAISAVGYIGSVMSNLVAELYT